MSAIPSQTSNASTVNSSLPIAKLINNGTTTSSSSSTTSSSTAQDASITSQLGPSAVLQLRTTQLSNQDPLNPVDDTQSISQLAQFSALQASDNLQTSFSNFQSNFGVLQSASLIGATVSVNTTDPTTGNASTISGTVNSIQVVNGAPTFTLYNPSTQSLYTDSNNNPLTFPTSAITAIAGSGASGATAAPSTSGTGSSNTNTVATSTGG
jgi:flagellar basal-body rod modification protein FlgD